MAVIVDDLASAARVVIQPGPVPIAISVRATSLKIIAVDADLLAGLRVRTRRHVAHQDAGSPGHTTQIPVFIHDLAATISVVFQAGIVPFTAAGLAAGLQVVAVSLDVFAGLRIGSAYAGSRVNSAIAARISRPITAAYTAQVAVLIGYVSAAIPVIVERGLMQAAVSGRAAGLQIVSFDPDVLAGLRVRSRRNAGLVAGLKPP